MEHQELLTFQNPAQHTGQLTWIAHNALCWVPSVLSRSLGHRRLQPTGPPCPWDSPGKNTGVDCLSHFQGVSPTQRSNLNSLMSTALAGKQVLYH